MNRMHTSWFTLQVADMDTVLQVITMLENIQITKEQLETTRLGRYINLLRRKTANESLARRAKNLLKKWREMVLPSVSAGNHQQQLQSNLTSKGIFSVCIFPIHQI